MLTLVMFGLRHNYSVGARLPISPTIILYIALPAFVVGRLAYFSLYACGVGWWRFFDVGSGGTMFMGVLLGGLTGMVTYLESRKIPLLQGIDVFVPYLPLAGILGRTGCLAYGCCWGTPCSLPWAIVFPKNSPAYSQHAARFLVKDGTTLSLPVQPSQIYAMIAFLIIFALLLAYRSSRPAPGRLLWAFLFMYSVKRLVLDCFRADHPAVYLGMNFVQCAACAFITATAAYCGLNAIRSGIRTPFRRRL